MRERKQFNPIVLKEWWPLFQMLDEHQLAEMMKAFVNYPDYVPDVPIWPFIDDQLKRQSSKFKDKCEKNAENVRRRAGNQTSSNDNEREQSLTNDNERERTSSSGSNCNDSETNVNLNKNINNNNNKESSSSYINVAREEINAELSALSFKGSEPVASSAAHTFTDKNKSSWLAFCKQERPDVDAAAMFDKFSAKYTAMNGSGPKLTDAEWFGKWKYWVNHEIVTQSEKGKTVKAPSFGTIGLGKAENIADNLCVALRKNPQDIPKTIREPGMNWSDLSTAIASVMINDQEAYNHTIAPLIQKYGIS